VVRQLTDRIVGLLSLAEKTYANGLEVPRPDDAAARRRVIIHPTSSSPAKNWLPDRFIELAARLRCAGWAPVFTVAPQEQAEWQARVGADSELRVFPGLKQLAAFYATATAFVGNDSGAGHLASCIGVPTVLIYKRWRRHPPWRHGWAPTRVVFARGLSTNDWQSRVSVDRVFRACVSLTRERTD
jgi:ADP-heptose:LPS heptosyltransferase